VILSPRGVLNGLVKEKHEPMAILDLLQAEFSGVGASGLWPRAVEDRNMKFSLFGQSINQSINQT
jgi:hypothetical protein